MTFTANLACGESTTSDRPCLHAETILRAALSALITSKIGSGWITDLDQLRSLEPFAEDAGFRAEFHRIKQANKDALAHHVRDLLWLSVDPKAIFDAQVKEIGGDSKVHVVRYEQHGKQMELSVGGVFIFIGFVPNSGLFKVHVNHDEAGYIVTDRNMQTSVEGIWAVGDVRAQLTKQIATAVGDGTTAAVAASMYVTTLKDAARA